MTTKKNNKTKLGDNLTSLMKHYSLGYRELGRHIDITHAYLSRLSKSCSVRPGVDVLKRIADFFGISLVQLMGEEKIDFKKLPKKLDLDDDKG